MVRLYRTFSNYISSEDTRCAGCSMHWFGEVQVHRSMRFKHSEPHRTFAHYILTDIARCINFFHMSSGWFDWTEPSVTTSLQEREGMQRAICTSWMRFKHSEPPRSFLNNSLTELARYIDCCHASSGWFDCTEPSPTTSLQGIQGVQGALCTGSGRFKHSEPH